MTGKGKASGKTNPILIAKGESWAQDNVHPATDSERAWAAVAFVAGVHFKEGLTAAESYEEFIAGYRAGQAAAQREQAKPDPAGGGK